MENHDPSSGTSSPRDSKGWDGKLRVNRKAVITNPEALSDPDYSDENAPPVEEIEADEDLLDDFPLDTDEIDLVHCRISSISSLKLERFTKTEKLCLRQNSIQTISSLSPLGSTLKDLDLYDNLISHVKGLEDLTGLRSLDLSFNKIKHIKNVSHLRELTDIYFVQNRISKIEALEGLHKLRNLELAANKIREIENLDSLTSLEELWLGKNKITELKNLNLPSLRILSIQSNRLRSLGDLSTLPALEELYVSHNALTTLAGVEVCTKVRVLDISNNRISSLSGIECLSHLEDFWASNNLLDSFQEMEKALGDKQELKSVYFEGNPIQRKNDVLYRSKVRLALPGIEQIDATFVKVS